MENALCNLASNLAQAADALIERESVEWVLTLTGGELDAQPRVTDAGYHFTYSYDGIPEWAGDDFDDKYDSGVEYFTMVRNCFFGEAPEVIAFNGRTYSREAVYVNSGERECPMRDMHECGGFEDTPTVVEDGRTVTAVENEECYLCGAMRGEGHGYIYLGDGWCEVVYRHVEQACADCNLTREDCKGYDGCECIAPTDPVTGELLPVEP